MAGEIIRPSDLPAATSVGANEAIPVDNGSSVRKATPAQIVAAGRPIASEAEAEGGVNNTNAMTPFRTKQAIDFIAQPYVDQAQAWAESPTNPDPTDPSSKSAKSWSEVAQDVVDQIPPIRPINDALPPLGNLIPVSQDNSLIYKGRLQSPMHLDNLWEPGIYRIQNAGDAAAVGAPVPVSGGLVTVRRTSPIGATRDAVGDGMQALVLRTDPPRYFLRRANGGASAVWSANWAELQSEAQVRSAIDAAVSEASPRVLAQPFRNAYRYRPAFSFPGKFSAYDALVATEGYTSFYASGLFIDHRANELWVTWPATGGDEANWYVVYDLTTMAEKTHFKMGTRWGKCFIIDYRPGGGRFLLSSGTNNRLVELNVTTLPAAGAAMVGVVAPGMGGIEAEQLGKVGRYFSTYYSGVNWNNVVYDGQIQIRSLDSFAQVRALSIGVSVAGRTTGSSVAMLKPQGMVLGPGCMFAAYGGISNSATDVEENKSKIQGVSIIDFNGNTISSGLFHPARAMEILTDYGLTSVTRFEHEGCFYDEMEGRVFTLWHTGNREQPVLVVEAFSDHEGAWDLSSAAVMPLPRVPDSLTLSRMSHQVDGEAAHYELRDPTSGAPIKNMTELCEWMVRFRVREVDWFTTNLNASFTWFDGTPLTNTQIMRVYQGNSATFMVESSRENIIRRWNVTRTGGGSSGTPPGSGVYTPGPEFRFLPAP